MLAALSQALSVPVTKRSEANAIEANTSDASTSVTKTEEAKSSVSKDSVAKDSTAKQQDQDETSKRELYEGNFGERNKEPVSSFGKFYYSVLLIINLINSTNIIWTEDSK